MTDELLELVEARFAQAGTLRYLCIHGDCHRNNVLWTAAGPHFVDLDDCMTGPAIQDLWMLLAGRPEEMRVQLADIVEGYSQFATFDPIEATLIEALRALRMVHYAAWLARRWHDPAFPQGLSLVRRSALLGAPCGGTRGAADCDCRRRLVNQSVTSSFLT